MILSLKHLASHVIHKKSKSESHGATTTVCWQSQTITTTIKANTSTKDFDLYIPTENLETDFAMPSPLRNILQPGMIWEEDIFGTRAKWSTEPRIDIVGKLVRQ